MDDKKLRRLENILLNVSASSKRWWLGGLVIGLLGAAVLYRGVVDGEGMAALLGAVLLGFAVGGTVDGYFWSRVGKYLEIRGTIFDRGGPRGKPVEPER